jgi:hypothetical protein
MKKPGWPGIATAVGLLWILAIVIGLWRAPDFNPEKWQTVIAAIIALGGGVAVYAASRIRIIYDRRIHESEIRRRRRGIFLRTDLAAFVMHHQAEHYKKELASPPPLSPPKTVQLAGLEFQTIPEFDQAWSELDAFPRAVAHDISNVRLQLFNVQNALKKLGPSIELRSVMCNETLEDLRKAIASISITAANIANGIRKELESLPDDQLG